MSLTQSDGLFQVAAAAQTNERHPQVVSWNQGTSGEILWCQAVKTFVHVDVC